MTAGFPDYVVDIEQRLRQIAGMVRRKGRMLLETYGITPPQFDALLILDRNGDLTIGDLSSRLFLAYSTTTDLVDRLERAGFVVRQRDSDDRRVVRVQMQASGSRLIENVLDARRAYIQSALQALDEQEHREILQALDVLHQKLSDD